MLFFNAAQSREIDSYAIQQCQIPGFLLMKRAALFSFQTLEKLWPDAQKISIICGTGNNGGDGFVLAQYAVLAGFEVEILLVGDRQKIANEAKLALDELGQLHIDVISFSNATETTLQNSDVIIDALLGTGLNSEVTGQHLQAIEAINNAKKPVLAIDIPSGLSADTGAALGQAVKASHTCCFISRKIGLYSYQGPEHSGIIHFSHLHLDNTIYQNFADQALAQNHSLKYWLNFLPQRLPTQHKGVSGSVCLIGGNHHMMGAIQLAGLASLKSGAGLVKIITRKDHITAITQTQPELMCYDKSFMPSQAPLTNALAIGPGLGLDDWATQRFDEALALPQNKVLDADALKILAKSPPSPHQASKANWVLTPHPGEAAEMLGCDTQQIQNDRVRAIIALQHRYGGTIVLKGNGTLVYDGQQIEICLAGNPGMATGGMGDVLSGCITTFLAQGLSPFEAACLGVSLHAHAGDIVAQQQGQISVLPSELAQTISQLMSYR